MLENIDDRIPYICTKIIMNSLKTYIDIEWNLLEFINNETLKIDNFGYISNDYLFLNYFVLNDLIVNYRVIGIDFSVDNNYDLFDDNDIKSLYNVKIDFTVDKNLVNFEKNNLLNLFERDFFNNLDDNKKQFINFRRKTINNNFSYYFIYHANIDKIQTYLDDYLKLWSENKLTYINNIGYKFNYIKPEIQISNFSKIIFGYIENIGNNFSYDITKDNELTVILYFEYAGYIKINYNYNLGILNNFEIKVLQKFYEDFGCIFSYNLSSNIKVELNKGEVTIYHFDNQYKLEKKTNADVLLEYILKDEVNIGCDIDGIEGIELFFRDNKKKTKKNLTSTISKQIENTYYSIFKKSSKYYFLKEVMDGKKIIKK